MACAEAVGSRLAVEDRNQRLGIAISGWEIAISGWGIAISGWGIAVGGGGVTTAPRCWRAIRCNQVQSGAIRCNQVSSAASSQEERLAIARGDAPSASPSAIRCDQPQSEKGEVGDAPSASPIRSSSRSSTALMSDASSEKLTCGCCALRPVPERYNTHVRVI